MSGNRIERRRHARREVSHDVDISVYRQGDKCLVESTALQDISESGARFVTRDSSRYSVGQSVVLTIYWPDKDRQRDAADCTATVVWIYEGGESVSGEYLDATVSVALDYVIDFDDIDGYLSGLPAA